MSCRTHTRTKFYNKTQDCYGSMFTRRENVISLHLKPFLKKGIQSTTVNLLKASNSLRVQKIGNVWFSSNNQGLLHEPSHKFTSEYLGRRKPWRIHRDKQKKIAIFTCASNNSEGSGEDRRKTSRIFSRDRILTNFLLALNIGIFVVSMRSQGKLTRIGAKVNHLIDQGEWWRLLTAALLHADVGHLLFNSMSLNNVGPAVEAGVGGLRFLLIYWTAAFTGFFLSYLMCPFPAVGASGAIMGLVGAQAVFFARHVWLFGNPAKNALTSLGQVILTNLVFGLMLHHVDNWGHLGGLIGGALTAWIVGPVYYRSRQLGNILELSIPQRLGISAKP